MDLGLAGKVAFIAGSSRGIGLATARSFLREGSLTVVTGRDDGSLAEARSSLEGEFGSDRLMAYPGDLRDPDVITAALAAVDGRWGRLDCLVANVGNGRGPAGWDLSEAEWDRLLEENLASAHRLVRHALPAMTRAERGSITFVASIAGLESTPAPMPYSAAKAALLSYGGNLARLLAREDIRVNCVAPGNILFPGGSWQRHLDERPDEVWEQIAAEVPMRRFGKPEEIADLIVFLSSGRASFVTGACVVADGGQTRSI